MAIAFKQTYEGLSKSIDPTGLTTNATERLLIHGFTLDTDADEITQIAAAAATRGTPPVTGLKIIAQSFARLAFNVGQVVFAWGLRDSKEAIEMDGTVSVVDASTVPTGSARQVTAVMSGMISTPANLVLQSTRTRQLFTGKYVSVEDYGHANRQQEIELGGTRTEYSQSRPPRRIVTSLVASTSDDATIAASEWATFKSTANAAGLVVDKVHPRAARVIKEYMGAAAAEQILVRSKTTGVRQQVKCIIDGGVAKVFVATAKEFYSGVYAATLTERETIVVVRTFSISRADTLSTVPDHPTKLLKTNNATFLGLSAGKVMYLSTDAVTNIAGAGPYPMQFAHSFLYLSIGHILDIDGWLDEIVTEEDVSGAPAWFTASDLGVTATIPSQTDFSVFLT
jgi:hypothetical protein